MNDRAIIIETGNGFTIYTPSGEPVSGFKSAPTAIAACQQNGWKPIIEDNGEQEIGQMDMVSTVPFFFAGFCILATASALCVAVVISILQ